MQTTPAGVVWEAVPSAEFFAAATGDVSSLTDRQRRFAVMYCGNGADAVRRAGYRGTALSLRVAASRLLRHPGVMALMGRLSAGRHDMETTKEGSEAA